jgi:hypothetical protein
MYGFYTLSDLQQCLVGSGEEGASWQPQVVKVVVTQTLHGVFCHDNSFTQHCIGFML